MQAGKIGLAPRGALSQHWAMSNAIDRHLADAERARIRGRADEARRHFEAVVAIDPDLAFAHNALGLEALSGEEPERDPPFRARDFRVGGEIRAWRAGEAFVFDDTIEHEAWNRSDRDRAVLIFDVWNPYLSETERALIARSFTVTDAHRAGRGKR